MPIATPKAATLLAIGLGLALLLLLLLPSSGGAAGQLYVFHEVKKQKRKLVFAPRGIAAKSVREARLKVRTRGKPVHRKIGKKRVRKAIRSRSKLRVRKPRRRGRVSGQLRITARPQGPTIAWGKGSRRPYSRKSPFNRRLPKKPRLHPNSRAIIDRWADQPDSNGFRFTAGNAGTRDDYDHPVYLNSPWDPRYRINCRRWTDGCEVHGRTVRIPAAARPAEGSDGHLTVIDQASGWEYDFWETERPSGRGGTLNVGHGGRTRINGKGLGSNSTAAHFGGAAGIIRPEELRSGKIPHALFLVVECTNDQSVWPAGPGAGRECHDVGESNRNAPAMGQHLYLDMSRRAIRKLRAPGWQKTILRAMANYGLFVGDTGGGSLKTLSGVSYTSFGLPDPWVKLGAKLPTARGTGDEGQRIHHFDMRETVDWESKLKVVRPCVSRRRC